MRLAQKFGLAAFIDLADELDPRIAQQRYDRFEAMACGTPVLAFRQGSVSEIIDQGVTGAIVDTMDEAVRMLPRVIELDRHAVRRRFEQRFSSILMAKDYVALYRALLKRPSISERETTVQLPRPVLAKKLNGQGLNGHRAHRAAETDALL
jgi:hypothetical protein